jgi:hypothetical protein
MAGPTLVSRAYWSEPETSFLVGLYEDGLKLWPIGQRMLSAGYPNRGRRRWYFKLREQVGGVKAVIDEGEPLNSEDRERLQRSYNLRHTDEQAANLLARTTAEVRALVAAAGLEPMRTSSQRVERGRPKIDAYVCASEAEAADMALQDLRSRMSDWRRDPAAAERRRINGEAVRQAQAVRASRSRPYRPQLSEAELRDARARAARAAAGARRS